MNDIIEKLGIKPVKRLYKRLDGFVFSVGVDPDQLQELEDQRNEMLEALIEDWQFLEHIKTYHKDWLNDRLYTAFYTRQKEIQKEIEEVCYPKTWEEIKKVLEEVIE